MPSLALTPQEVHTPKYPYMLRLCCVEFSFVKLIINLPAGFNLGLKETEAVKYDSFFFCAEIEPSAFHTKLHSQPFSIFDIGFSLSC